MRRKNLKIQLNEIMNDKLRIGHSRHKAKEQYKNKCKEKGIKAQNLKSEYIHSIKTAQNYREVLNSFCDWIRKEHKDIWNTKDITKIDKGLCYKYMRERENRGLSPYTISRDLGALNKLLDLKLTKKEGGLAKRSYKQLKRSRNQTNKELSKSLLAKNYEQILIAKATGMRRSSMLRIKKSDFIKNEKTSLYVKVKLVEKGGKYREAPILQDYQQDLTKIIDAKKEGVLFDYYSKSIDNHSFRAEYAEERYKELLEGRLDKKDYRGYDKEAIAIISKNLGHNRLTVVCENYLGK